MNDSDPRADGSRDDRPCPRCRCPLYEGIFDSATLLGCGRCGGVWLDAAASRAVVDGAGQAFAQLADLAARRATTPPPKVSATQDAAPCPVCRQPLQRGFVPGTTVEIDACGADGTWFDADELRVVALAFAKLPPPLTFAREDYEEHDRFWQRDDDGNWSFTLDWDSSANDDEGVDIVGAIIAAMRSR
jgi:Zn-finger nucleic acid-binding protein